MFYPTTPKKSCQPYGDTEILHDIDDRGRERPWATHKLAGQVLAAAYDVSGDNKKAARVRTCGDVLQFAVTKAGLKLEHAIFCRCRLCPTCQWRRALKLYGQAYSVVSYLATKRITEGQKPYTFLMLTLTIKNVPAHELSHTLTEMGKGWQRLMQREQITRIVQGSMRCIEITRNAQTGEYHPHIHALIAVLPSYFKSRYYLPQEKWATLWGEACRIKYNPVVDIRKTYGDAASSMAEIAKYAAKPSDYIDPSDIDTMMQVVQELDAALSHRRFVAWGGCMASAHKMLHLDDVDTGDLIHTQTNDDEDNKIGEVSFGWMPGLRIYIRE